MEEGCEKKVNLFAALYKLFIFAVIQGESLEIRSEWVEGMQKHPAALGFSATLLGLLGRMCKSLLLDKFLGSVSRTLPTRKQTTTHSMQPNSWQSKISLDITKGCLGRKLHPVWQPLLSLKKNCWILSKICWILSFFILWLILQLYKLQSLE